MTTNLAGTQTQGSSLAPQEGSKVHPVVQQALDCQGLKQMQHALGELKRLEGAILEYMGHLQAGVKNYDEDEAKRIEKLKKEPNNQYAKNQTWAHHYLPSSKYTANVKRKTMDVTRALVPVRNPTS